MEKDKHQHFWKEIGKSDPYFGVMSHEKYRTARLDENALKDFFETGQKHISNVLGIFEHIWPTGSFKNQHALDFGCGTGRLTIPLSNRFASVKGVDISSTMLFEAEKNMQAGLPHDSRH